MLEQHLRTSIFPLHRSLLGTHSRKIPKVDTAIARGCGKDARLMWMPLHLGDDTLMAEIVNHTLGDESQVKYANRFVCGSCSKQHILL